MRYNPYGLFCDTAKSMLMSRLSMVKKKALTDPVRVVVIVMAVLSTNCISAFKCPHTIIFPCRICILWEYRLLIPVGEVSGLTALPEVTGIVTSSLFRVYDEKIGRA